MSRYANNNQALYETVVPKLKTDVVAQNIIIIDPVMKQVN